LTRKRIFRELIRATDLFDEKKGSVRSDLDAEKLLLEVVLHIFGFFAKEASGLAMTANWAGERFESECLTVLSQCVFGAGLKRGGRIPESLQITIERSEQWKRYRLHLREIADSQAAGEVIRSERPKGESGGATDTTHSTPKVAVGTHRRRPGFAADAKGHNSIAEIVGRHDPIWNAGSKHWRGNHALKRICTDLDGADIDVPENWRTGATPSLTEVKLKNWSDAFELGFKKLVVDRIRYSLEKCQKRSSAQET
jgi:hypothetical protein